MKSNLGLLVFLIFGLSHYSHGQCGSTVDAGPDQLFCPGENSVTLSAQVGGDAFEYEWESDPTLDDRFSLTPSVTPDVTTVYTLAAYSANPADNLVINGDFEQGNIGFSSEYDFSPGGQWGPISDDGTYDITTNSNASHSLFNTCSDNSGSGNMMACNGSTQQNIKVWCQTVAVNPSETYVLRAYIASIWDVGAAELQFSINNDLVGDVFVPELNPPCTYDFFDERWTSGPGETTAEICVVNQTTIFFGYNFSLDDIFFAPVCVEYDQVTVEVPNLELDLDDEYILPCLWDNDAFTLEPTGVPYTDTEYSYAWSTTDGDIISGSNQPRITAQAEGTYTLRLSYDNANGSCQIERSVTVVQTESQPFVELDGLTTLNCNEPTITIFSENSYVPPGSVFDWETTEGNIITPTDLPDVAVTAQGTYSLTITSPAGCFASAVFTVDEDFSEPAAVVAPPQELTCNRSEVTLNGSATVLGPNDVFLWDSSDGNFSGGTQTLMPTVTSPGTYILFVTNEVTGCFDELNVVVGGSTEPAVAAIEQPPVMDCIGTPIMLTAAEASTGNGVAYAWSSPDGQIDGPSDEIDLTVSAPGTYVFSVTSANGCTAVDSQVVTQDNFMAEIDILPADPLTCVTNSISLEAMVTTEVNVDYAWNSADGNISDGQNTLSPSVSTAGSYQLVVTEQATGCRQIANITVSADTTRPVADAGQDQSITCLFPTALLTSIGDNDRSTVAWSNPEGNDVSTLTSSPGLFLLTVTDTINGCFALDSVEVLMDTVRPVVTLTTPITELTCSREEIELGQLTPVSNISFQWIGPQDTVNAPLITATAAGTYTLLTTSVGNGCTDTDTVLITSNTEQPQFTIAQPEVLTCEHPQRELLATIDNPDGFVPFWTTTGNITAGAAGLSPTINAPGNYQLVLRNPATGCADSISVTVLQDTVSPGVQIAPAPPLTCNRTDLSLDATGTTAGDSITYHWSSDNGNFVGMPAGLNPLVDAAGNYHLLTRNILNGCEDSATVVVAIDTLHPIAMTEQSAPALTCRTPSVLLDAPTADAGISVQWTGPGVDDTTRQVTVTAPGMYSVLLIDPDNGCRDSATVVLQAFQELPILNIAPPSVLTCAAPVVSLDATIVNPDGFQVVWSGTGELANGPDALTPMVTEPGDYQLLMFNPTTGCADSLQVAVRQNIVSPEAVIAAPTALTCAEPVLQLDGQGSSQGDSISYFWSSVTGSFVAGQASDLPSVDGPGLYRLMVINTNNGCVDSSEVTVIDNADRPTVELGENRILNCTDTIQLLTNVLPSAADLTAQWSSGSGVISDVSQPTLEVTAPGTYYLTLSNPENGCFTSDSIIILQDITRPAVQITGPAALTCTNPTVTLVGEDTTPNHPASYSWLAGNGNTIPGATGAELIVDASDTYQLILTYPHNGCRDTTEIMVQTDTLAPALDLPDLPTLNCLDTTASIIAAVLGDTAAFSYEWFRDGLAVSDPSFGPEYIVTEPGNYRLVVTDVTNGCINSVDGDIVQDILKPEVGPLADAVLTCQDDAQSTSVTLLSSRPEVDYLWSTSDGVLPGGTTSANLSVMAPGTYSVLVVDPQNSCFTQADWQVGQDVVRPVASLAAELDLGCDPAPVSIAVEVPPGNDYQFSWTTAGGEILSSVNQPGIELMGAGSYEVVVRDAGNGCTTALELLATQMFLEDVTTSLSLPDCQRSTGGINFDLVNGGIGPYLFSIDGGASYFPGTNFAGLSPGRYEIGVQDVRGCELSDIIDIPEARELELSTIDDLFIKIGDSVQLEFFTNFPAGQIDTIVWTPSTGFNCTGCLSPVVRPLSSTNYQVSVTTTDGCVASEQVAVFVNEELEIYFPTAFSPNGDGINDCWIPLADTTRFPLVRSLVITDRWGGEVFNAANLTPDDSNTGWDGRSRGRFLNPGVFIWSAIVERFDGKVEQVGGELVLSR